MLLTCQDRMISQVRPELSTCQRSQQKYLGHKQQSNAQSVSRYQVLFQILIGTILTFLRPEGIMIFLIIH